MLRPNLNIFVRLKNGFSCPLNKKSHPYRTNFGTKMHIHARKLAGAKFSQYAYQSAQHKMVQEERIAVEFEGIFLPLYGID